MEDDGAGTEAGDFCHRIGDKMPATVLRLFAVGLGVFVLAGFSFVMVDFPHVHHAPAIVFAAVDPGCQIVDDANNKLLNTSWH